MNDLAAMIKEGFDEMGERINVLEQGHEQTHHRLDGLEEGQEQIRLRLDNVAYRFEIKELDQRVTKLEHHIGFSS